VSDNCSTDDTKIMVQTYQAKYSHIDYSCHPLNLGGNANIIHCHGIGAGRYRWVMGDDDAISTGQLVPILNCLQRSQPALFINSSGGYAYGFKTPALFEDYRAFARTCAKINPHALVAHSLITSNIFRSECFDGSFARSKIETSYGHMYGLVQAMSDSAGGVYVAGRQTITVRDSSLDPADGIWPSDMYALWRDYLNWLRTRLHLTDIDGSGIHRYIQHALVLEFKAQPFRAAWRYGKRLSHLQTWISVKNMLKRSC